MTEVSVKDLATPIHSTKDGELDLFQLRDEVKNGKVKYRVRLDSGRLDVPAKCILPIKRLFESEWQKSASAALFFGDNRWMPWKSDPAMKSDFHSSCSR